MRQEAEHAKCGARNTIGAVGDMQRERQRHDYIALSARLFGCSLVSEQGKANRQLLTTDLQLQIAHFILGSAQNFAIVVASERAREQRNDEPWPRLDDSR